MAWNNKSLTDYSLINQTITKVCKSVRFVKGILCPALYGP